MFDRGKNFRGANAENDADQSANGTERNRFDQELSENITAVRAHRHARPDFAGPFRDTHEHDVHDADAADHERHAGNRAQQSRHDVGRRGGRLRDFLLIAHGEIVVATGPDVVSLPNKRDDLLLRRFEIGCASATWTLMLRKVVPPATRFIALV